MATTTAPATYPLPRERAAIIVALLVLAAAGWAVLLWQSNSDDDEMGLTMGMEAPLFIATWVVMMVAMMFPTAAPMALAFRRIETTNKARGAPYVNTSLFVAAYLVLWSAAGVLAFIAASLLDDLAGEWQWLMDNAARIGGGVILLVAAYQFTPLKTVCLSRCRTPMSFILGAWREGRPGAVKMGFHHGVICLGCCWMLFVLLFPLGIMNVAAMAIVTLVIFAEKSLSRGVLIGRLGAGALAIYGVAVLIFPDLLPATMGDDDEMTMDGAMSGDSSTESMDGMKK